MKYMYKIRKKNTKKQDYVINWENYVAVSIF